MTVYAYCRVSTARQVEGESLAQQQRRLEGYATVQDWEIGAVFVEEGVSGSVPLEARPQGGKMLRGLVAGDVVIATRLDRVFRSALDALQVVQSLRDAGVTLHLLDLGGDATGSGMARLFLTIAAAFAEQVREGIRERVAESKADQKARGRHLGGPVPFGFVAIPDPAPGRGATLHPDEAQQQAIVVMCKLRARKQSLRKIQNEMVRRGFALSYQGVKRVLARQAA